MLAFGFCDIIVPTVHCCAFVAERCRCIGCYLLASLSTLPILGLAGCALCGLAVGIMWPGTIGVSSQECLRGGTAMFAFLALAI